MRGQTFIAAGWFLLISTASALGGTFDIKSPEVTKGETELATNHSLQSGFPDNADRVRHSWEIFLGYGFTERFKAGIKGGFDTPVSENMQFSTVSVETQYYLGKLTPVISWAWFIELAAGVHHDETNTVIFGPLIQFGDDKRSLTCNTLFEQTFGRNREDGIAFTYAIGVKQELREGLAIGIEGHGSIPDIGDAPSVDFQEHRVGPVLYVEPELRAGQKSHKLAIEVGGFVGLTKATPDFTGKLKASLTCANGLTHDVKVTPIMTIRLRARSAYPVAGAVPHWQCGHAAATLNPPKDRFLSRLG